MSILEASIESLSAEHTALAQKLEQIDQQYRVDRPVVINQLKQLARALSALTGKPVARPFSWKPMSEEGKAAIRAGLEHARAAKRGIATTSAPIQKPAILHSRLHTEIATIPPRKEPTSEKTSTSH